MGRGRRHCPMDPVDRQEGVGEALVVSAGEIEVAGVYAERPPTSVVPASLSVLSSQLPAV